MAGVILGTMDRENLGSRERYECPRQCGWYREWRGAEWWKRQIVTHPIYGAIPNMEVVRLDVDKHDCYEYKHALRQLHRKQKAAA